MVRCTKAAFLIALSWTQTRCGAFSPYRKRSSASSRMRLCALPSIEQLAKDPFMKQVVHASEIVPLISMDKNDDISELLHAQFSHSDGIRGFFVVYLTCEGSSTADAPTVPSALAAALKTVMDQKDLVSLACMNVIMPTAMSTMHTEASLQANSSRTAARGITILKYLAKLYPEHVKSTCEAIMATAGDVKSSHAEQVSYWRKFFSNYNYEDQQRRDILAAIASIGFQSQ